jgi:sugar lactone lactonase YvrE
VDSSGNVFVADIDANTIRKLTPMGTNWVVTTIAGGGYGSNDGTNNHAHFNGPSGVVADAVGNLYVSDQWNHTVRKITPAGTNWVVTTIAGVPGSYGTADGTNRGARFHSPGGLALDSGGNLYVADTYNYTIRKITPVGTNWIVSTIGGAASIGYTDGTNSAARFYIPNGVAVDSRGDVFVADQVNNTIRLGVSLPVFQVPTLTSGAFNLAWSAVAGQSFQVQFKTNFAQRDWINVGGPVAGTNGTAAGSDIAPPDPQRFYRVLLLP